MTRSTTGDPVAATASGRLRGLDLGGVHTFLGVPYAEPPVGDLRFRPPVPRLSWHQTRDATVRRAAAPQPVSSADVFDIDVTSEDCLYLNIWTPDLDGAAPTLLWIHGGGFLKGSGSERVYDGAQLARDRGLVVVTMTYRLGVLGGFVYLNEIGDERFLESANVGLLDQRLALSWVRDNIAAFGGDPDALTVAGESAGGTSVVHLIAANAGRGTIARGIVMSPAPVQTVSRDDALRVTESYLRHLGNPSPTRLFRLSTDELVGAQARIRDEFRLSRVVLAYQPILDGAALSTEPLADLTKGASEVPLLVGSTRDELVASIAKPFPGDDADGAIRALCRSLFPDPTVADRLSDAYSVDALAAADPSCPPPIAAFQSDRVIRMSAIRTLEAQVAGGGTGFAFMFQWLGINGATHLIDVPFLFGTTDVGPWPTLLGDGATAAFTDRFQDIIAAFIVSGDPGEAGAEWPAYTLDRRATFLIAEQERILEDPWARQRTAWNGVL
jgi:para-nitrobenzyl esterase